MLIAQQGSKFLAFRDKFATYYCRSFPCILWTRENAISVLPLLTTIAAVARRLPTDKPGCATTQLHFSDRLSPHQTTQFSFLSLYFVLSLPRESSRLPASTSPAATTPLERVFDRNTSMRSLSISIFNSSDRAGEILLKLSDALG
jgi:hypothetical protein